MTMSSEMKYSHAPIAAFMPKRALSSESELTLRERALLTKLTDSIAPIASMKKFSLR